MQEITTNEYRQKTSTTVLTVLLIAFIIVAGEVALHFSGFVLKYMMPRTF
jgi:hypothetical protein